MTATTVSTTSAVNPHVINRMIAVLKLHFTNKWTILAVPWLIMAAILLMNLAIWAIILSAIPTEAGQEKAQAGFVYSGSSFYMFIYMMVVAVQAVNVTFPFALGYGVTRKHYYLGTVLSFVSLSAIYALGFSLLAVIEQATEGWGLGGYIFSAFYFGEGPWPVWLFIYFTLFLFFFFVGSIFASVWVRWRANGLIAAFIALAFFLVGVFALISLTNSWNAVGDWMINTGLVGLYAWTLVPTVLSAIASYLILRKATPRN